MRSVSANGQKTSLKLESGSGIARAAAEVSLAGADPRDFADSGTLQKDARMEWKKNVVCLYSVISSHIVLRRH